MLDPRRTYGGERCNYASLPYICLKASFVILVLVFLIQMKNNIMKKIKIFLITLVLLLSLLLTACDISSIPVGVDGEDGLSAYDLAVQNGFEGTLDEWLASLKGKDGRDGARGADGEDGEDGQDGQDGLNAPGSLDGQLESSFVVVTEYLDANTGRDVSNAIQSIIDSNPNRTIYFPDGEYIVSKPIKTSADSEKSVSLLLSNYAEIKASSNWNYGTNYAVIMLGAAAPHSEAAHSSLANNKTCYNNVHKAGSNYFLEGGIINGNGKANGISIDCGRETRVENVSIKNTPIGLHIKSGVNSVSADADIINVNICGNGKANSIGLLIDAYDNTVDNMRITGVKTGVHLKKGGNFLRDVHPLVDNMQLYSGSVGFLNEGGNWFDVCYSDQFETGFKTVGAGKSIFTNCYAYWWYNNEEHTSGYQVQKEIAFLFLDQFNSTLQNCRVEFRNSNNTENAFMKVSVNGGAGIVFNPLINDKNDNDTYLDYMVPLR